MAMIKAIIVENSPLVRQALENIFRSQFPSIELVETANGKNAMGKIETFHPEIILIDIQLPEGKSLELARAIRARHPEVIIIMLSSHDAPEYRKK
jgi:YesN/AraC family two-component response regulator